MNLDIYYLIYIFITKFTYLSPVTECDNEEICDLTYVEMNRNKYIVGVGWDRRINIYSDDMSDSNIHHIQHPLPKWHDDVVRINVVA